MRISTPLRMVYNSSYRVLDIEDDEVEEKEEKKSQRGGGRN